MKQTAVEWLLSEFSNHIDMPNKHFNELIEQSKEMEKQQIEHAFKKGFISDGFSEFEQYYNETYNK